MLEEALRSENLYQRKAGLLVLAVLSDGAGDHIRQRYLFNPCPRVRWAVERRAIYPVAILICLLFQLNYQ
jgi:hypothetical protein